MPRDPHTPEDRTPATPDEHPVVPDQIAPGDSSRSSVPPAPSDVLAPVALDPLVIAAILEPVADETPTVASPAYRLAALAIDLMIGYALANLLYLTGVLGSVQRTIAAAALYLALRLAGDLTGHPTPGRLLARVRPPRGDDTAILARDLIAAAPALGLLAASSLTGVVSLVLALVSVVAAVLDVRHGVWHDRFAEAPGVIPTPRRAGLGLTGVLALLVATAAAVLAALP